MEAWRNYTVVIFNCVRRTPRLTTGFVVLVNLEYDLTILVLGRNFFYLLQGPETAQAAEELARVVLVLNLP